MKGTILMTVPMDVEGNYTRFFNSDEKPLKFVLWNGRRMSIRRIYPSQRVYLEQAIRCSIYCNSDYGSCGSRQKENGTT